MQRTFTIETSEADERALAHVYRSGQIDFALDSILQGQINSVRQQLIRAEKERVLETGEILPVNEDAIILNAKSRNADERHDDHMAQMAKEREEYEKKEQERLDKLAQEEAERLRIQQEAIDRAVAAALAAEREKNNASE